MNRKKIVYVIALGISGTAFSVDRLFLGKPDTASAAISPIAGPPSGGKHPLRQVAEAKPVLASDPTLAWLERLAKASEVRDVFALSSRFEARQRILAGLAEQPPAPEPEVDPVEVFIENHKLQTTLTAPEGALAVVNGEVLRPGDRIADFRLVRVDAYHAHFRDDRRKKTVSLVMELPFQPAASAVRSDETPP